MLVDCVVYAFVLLCVALLLYVSFVRLLLMCVALLLCVVLLLSNCCVLR